MKKQINATGVNGTFTGFVQVDLDFTIVFKGEPKFHRIIGIVEGVTHGIETVRPDRLFEVINTIESRVTHQLQLKANEGYERPPETSLAGQLKAKGFV